LSPSGVSSFTESLAAANFVSASFTALVALSASVKAFAASSALTIAASTRC